MAASSCCYLVEGIAAVVIAYSLVLLRGKPQIRIFRIGRWQRARNVVIPAGASFLELLLAGGVLRRSDLHLARR
jgi:hypothetical protein